MPSISDLVQGIVVETKLPSKTGDMLYSDTSHYQDSWSVVQYSVLDHIASIPIVGIVAGITKVALATLHTLNHSLALIFTLDSRHCVHLAKGGCELLKGLIQSIPIAGHIFTRFWMRNDGEWWIIKIYNPDAPDSLDEYANYWLSLKQNRPSAYIVA